MCDNLFVVIDCLVLVVEKLSRLATELIIVCLTDVFRGMVFNNIVLSIFNDCELTGETSDACKLVASFHFNREYHLLMFTIGLEFKQYFIEKEFKDENRSNQQLSHLIYARHF